VEEGGRGHGSILKTHPAEKTRESRIGAETVEPWTDLDHHQKIVPHLESLFDPFKGFIDFAQSAVDDRQVHRSDIPAPGAFHQLPKDLLGLIADRFGENLVQTTFHNPSSLVVSCVSLYLILIYFTMLLSALYCREKGGFSVK
jgi:hypothetical protein